VTFDRALWGRFGDDSPAVRIIPESLEAFPGIFKYNPQELAGSVETPKDCRDHGIRITRTGFERVALRSGEIYGPIAKPKGI
jgi:hypothetical protein